MGDVAAEPIISIGNVSVGGYEQEIIVPINFLTQITQLEGFSSILLRFLISFNYHQYQRLIQITSVLILILSMIPIVGLFFIATMVAR